jgi:hypothetical protein
VELNSRQRRVLTQTISVYRPVYDRDGASPTAPRWELVGTYSGRIFQAPESSHDTTLGRGTQDIIFTMDILKVPLGTTIHDGWFVEMGGDWWSVAGGARDRDWRAMESGYYLKKSVKPRGIG